MKSCRLLRRGCGTFIAVTGLFLCAHPVRAQYALIPASDYLNVYFYDGFSTVYGTDPTPYTVNGTGTPLTAYSWVTGSTTPGAEPGGSYNSGSLSSANANAQVSYQQASFFIGSNSVSQSAISPIGTSLVLNNTGSGIAELRVDWTAAYLYSGANGVYLPDILAVHFTGSLGTYALLAGEETFQVNSGPTYTAGIPVGGDWSSPAGYPVGANGNANFWGYEVTTPFDATPSGNGGPVTVNTGDTVTVNGFIDVIVDPGSAQVVIEPVPEATPAALSMLGLLVWAFAGWMRKRG